MTYPGLSIVQPDKNSDITQSALVPRIAQILVPVELSALVAGRARQSMAGTRSPHAGQFLIACSTRQAAHQRSPRSLRFPRISEMAGDRAAELTGRAARGHCCARFLRGRNLSEQAGQGRGAYHIVYTNFGGTKSGKSNVPSHRHRRVARPSAPVPWGGCHGPFALLHTIARPVVLTASR